MSEFHNCLVAQGCHECALFLVAEHSSLSSFLLYPLLIIPHVEHLTLEDKQQEKWSEEYFT